MPSITYWPLWRMVCPWKPVSLSAVGRSYGQPEAESASCSVRCVAILPELKGSGIIVGLSASVATSQGKKKGRLYRPLGRNASHEFRLLAGKPTLKIDYQSYRGFWNFYAPLSILASPCQRYLVAPPYQYGRASGPWRFVNGLADDRGCKRDSCSHADTNCLTCTLYTYRPDPDTA